MKNQFICVIVLISLELAWAYPRSCLFVLQLYAPQALVWLGKSSSPKPLKFYIQEAVNLSGLAGWGISPLFFVLFGSLKRLGQCDRSLVQEGWGLLLSCGIKEPEHPGAGNALQMCLETT